MDFADSAPLRLSQNGSFANNCNANNGEGSINGFQAGAGSKVEKVEGLASASQQKTGIRESRFTRPPTRDLRDGDCLGSLAVAKSLEKSGRFDARGLGETNSRGRGPRVDAGRGGTHAAEVAEGPVAESTEGDESADLEALLSKVNQSLARMSAPAPATQRESPDELSGASSLLPDGIVVSGVSNKPSDGRNRDGAAEGQKRGGARAVSAHNGSTTALCLPLPASPRGRGARSEFKGPRSRGVVCGGKRFPNRIVGGIAPASSARAGPLEQHHLSACQREGAATPLQAEINKVIARREFLARSVAESVDDGSRMDPSSSSNARGEANAGPSAGPSAPSGDARSSAGEEFSKVRSSQDGPAVDVAPLGGAGPRFGEPADTVESFRKRCQQRVREHRDVERSHERSRAGPVVVTDCLTGLVSSEGGSPDGPELRRSRDCGSPGEILRAKAFDRSSEGTALSKKEGGTTLAETLARAAEAEARALRSLFEDEGCSFAVGGHSTLDFDAEEVFRTCRYSELLAGPVRCFGTSEDLFR